VHASGRLDLSYAFICRLIGLDRGGAVDLAVRDVADTILFIIMTASSCRFRDLKYKMVGVLALDICFPSLNL